MFILLLSFAGIAVIGGNTNAEPTREVVTYTAYIDPDVEDENICLAGHRWFQLDLSFQGLYGRNISVIGLDLQVETVSTRVLSYNVLSEELEQTSLFGQLSIRNGVIGVEDLQNITFSVELFFHLNWSFDRSFNMKPSMILNGTTPSFDTPSLLEVKVHGGLEPADYSAADPDGAEVGFGQTLRSNTSMTFKDIRFKYYHSLYSVAGFNPRPEEVEANIILDDQEWKTQWNSSGFEAVVDIPDQSEGKITFRMRLSNVAEDWQTKVAAWSFVVDLDGLSPQFNLVAPQIKIADASFNWEVDVIDRPAPGDYQVDGSSMSFRISVDGVWGQWQEVEAKEDGQSVKFEGSGSGMMGKNKTKIQFMASDVLGNTGVSDEFTIMINLPPIVTIPDGLEGSIYWDNETLDLNGYHFASDPDDTQLQFAWYLDDESKELSTNSNLSKNLFNEQPGPHVLTIKVTDAFGGEAEASFNFTLNAVPIDEEETSIMDILSDPFFLTIAIPILVLIIFGILIVIIIVVSKKLRRADDFVINEDSNLSSTQAEEMAKKIRALYEEREVYATVDTDEARITDDEGKFDFDYDLYEVLDLEKGADVAQIKKSYRKLAAFYHPDRIAIQPDIDPEDAAEQMIRVNKAKEFLLNPDLKAEYDEYISDMDFSFDLNSDDDGDDDWD